MYNYPDIISPRIEILKEIQFSSDSLNKLKSELLKMVSEQKFVEKNIINLKIKYSNLISDINQNGN